MVQTKAKKSARKRQPDSRAEWPLRWLYMRQLFLPDEAQSLIAASERHGYGQATYVDGSPRENVMAAFLERTDAKKLHIDFFYPRIVRGGCMAAHVLDLKVDEEGPSAVQFARYFPGDHYGMHSDHDPLGTTLPRDRKLSLYVSLVDGGTLGFRDGEMLVNAGDAVAFSAIEPHFAPEQTQGVRYSLVAWFNGARWT